MKTMKSYLSLLFIFIVLGCTGIGGTSTSSPYTLKYRLNETDDYKPLDTSDLKFKYNIEVNFKNNGNEVTFVLDGAPIAEIDITRVIDKTSNIKILKKDNTLIKEYLIEVNKENLNTYAPFLMEERKDDIGKVVKDSNSLPSMQEGFNSNILQIFIKNEAKEILSKRIKKIYYVDTSKDNYDLNRKADAIEILVSVAEIVKNNYPVIVTKNRLGSDLGIKLYGLEYFKQEGENKENLVSLGEALLTSVNLPWITLSDDLGNVTTLKLNELQSENEKINFRPVKYKFTGFKGKVKITYKTKEDAEIASFTEELGNELFKFYRNFQAPNPIENIEIGKIEFKFIYNEDSSFTTTISIPNVILKYRTDDKEEKYIPLTSNSKTFDQNIELILEGEDGDLYIDNELINRINGKTTTIIKKPITNVKIKSKIDDANNIILRECIIKVEKAAINSAYAPILIKKEGEELTSLNDDTNSLPSQGFNSNILQIFIKNEAKEILSKRIKTLYYIDTLADDYNFDDKSSAQEINLDTVMNEGFIVTKDKLDGNLGIKLYGLEYFEVERTDKVNLIPLGDELLTKVLAPWITLADEFGNVVSVNTNEVLNLNRNIDFSPTKYKITGFKGTLEVNYKNSEETDFKFLYRIQEDEELFKEFSDFNFIIPTGASIKEIQFKFIYSSTSSFTTTIKSPSFILKYKLKDNEAYQNFNYNSIDAYDQNVKLLLQRDESDLYISGTEDTKILEQNGEISTVIKNTTNFKLKAKDKDILLKNFTIKVEKEAINSTYYPILINNNNGGISEDYDEDNVLPSKEVGLNSNILKIQIKDNSKDIVSKRIKTLYYTDTSVNDYDLEDKSTAKIISEEVETINSNGFSIAIKLRKGDLGLKLYGLEYLDEPGDNNQNLIALGDALLTSSSTPLVFLEMPIGGGTVIDAEGGAELENTLDFRPAGFIVGGFKGTIIAKYTSQSGSTTFDYNMNSLYQPFQIGNFSSLESMELTFIYDDLNMAQNYKLKLNFQ